MSGPPPDPPTGPPAAPEEILDGGSENSLLDLVDHLLNQGVVASGDLVLGLADVDLIYLRLEALLCAADRVLPDGRRAAGGPPAAPPAAPAAAWDAGDGPPPHGDALEARSDASGGHGGADPESAVAAGDDRDPPAPAAARAAPHHTAAGTHAAADDLHPLAAEELESLRGELEERLDAGTPARWNADPENARRAVAKLVLALVDFLRQLMERQAIRRMDAGSLTAEEVERVGVALMRLEETLHEMAERFGIPAEELNLDLGPLGRLT